MVERDVRARLYDALQAATDARSDLGDTTLDAFLEDRRLRQAIYWQVMTIGEALNQAAQIDPRLRDQVPSFVQIVGTRNRIIHAYGQINDELIWATVRDRLPELAVWLQMHIATRPVSDDVEEP